MRPVDFQWMTRFVILLLPFFMGGVEFMLRVALKQPGQAEFFPISLVSAGASLNASVTVVPYRSRSDLFAGALRSYSVNGRTIFIAKLGVFASIVGAILWLYLLTASFSAEVMGILPFHPARDAALYYFFLAW
jgi:hypothetical protein